MKYWYRGLVLALSLSYAWLWRCRPVILEQRLVDQA